MRADGSQLQRLTNSFDLEDCPQWSPDGQGITFTVIYYGSQEIYRMRADGTDQQRLTSATAIGDCPQWAPDGQWIVFEAYHSTARSGIYRIRANGTDLQYLVDNPGSFNMYPQWSPPLHRSWHPWRLLGLCGVMLAISLVPEKLTRWRER
jgi:Tol biopolymer transport system component